MPKDTRSPQEILDHIIQARVALTSAIYGLSTDELMAVGVVGHWSVKDVMAHVGRWESVCYEVLQNHLKGIETKEDYRDADTFNARWEAELRALSLPETIVLFETSHHRLLALLASLQPEQWNGYVRAWTTGSTWHHFEEHAGQIRTWRQRRSSN